MAIKQFTIGCSRTLNLGNFESMRVEASVVMEVDEDTDWQLVKANAQGVLRNLLEETYKHQRNGKKPHDQ